MRALTPEDLAKSPNPLARHYSRFRVGERLLLTGHSHQAWPDVAFEGQVEAWNDAAELVDDKWEKAANRANRMRAGFARLLGDGARPEEIALGTNTHELVLRVLSALPLAERPRLVTTDGEFHTIRRQLDRLAETRWIELLKVAAEPTSTLAERLIAAVDGRTAAVLASSVLFTNAHIVPGLGRVLEACRRAGAELLVDAYHHLNVVPFSLAGNGLTDAFVVGGGYKYCQLGEGNCFLRVPPGREGLRPVLTGWFAEFDELSDKPPATQEGVHYASGPAQWAGATYDPVSHHRGARVFDFFVEQGLTADVLRALSRHQVALLARTFDALDLDPAVLDRDRTTPLEQVGGFLALRSPNAGEIAARLRTRGVWVDFRGEVMRLGPAPYLEDRQLTDAIGIFGALLDRKRAGA
ncbi:MAG: kynureninase [Candidatus Eiseniibacteriota bacterium]